MMSTNSTALFPAPDRPARACCLCGGEKSASKTIFSLFPLLWVPFGRPGGMNKTGKGLYICGDCVVAMDAAGNRNAEKLRSSLGQEITGRVLEAYKALRDQFMEARD